MNDGSESPDLDQEWENRVLCSDESCIGTIGPDGRCRECGRLYEGALPEPTESGTTREAAAEDDGDADVSGVSPANDNSIEEDSSSITDDEWERRTLCPDESCIGVIGPDGRCRECGRSLGSAQK
jgi:hypothetical protein